MEVKFNFQKFYFLFAAPICAAAFLSVLSRYKGHVEHILFIVFCCSQLQKPTITVPSILRSATTIDGSKIPM